MAAPTVYIESDLQEYMLSVTSSVATAIKFPVEDFSEAVNDTLIAYGVATINLATNIAKLRAIAKVMAWRAMVERTASEYDYSTDTGATGSSAYQKRNQLHTNAENALKIAEAEAVRLGYITIGTLPSNASGSQSVMLTVVY